MKILQSYLNEYKQVASTKELSSSISNKMLKYIVGSCFKKMSFRAFHWASCYMIGILSSLSWDSVPPFPTVPIGTDRRLSNFLKSPLEENSTFGDWVMAYNPSKSPGSSPSLNIFLDPASGTSAYKFDRNIATIFHSLLLSSIYAYICSIKQIKFSISKGDDKGYQKHVGEFCNAIRILYLVSHSNAMKAYFSSVEIPIFWPTHTGSAYFKNIMNNAIRTQLLSRGWDEKILQEVSPGVSNGGESGDKENLNRISDDEDEEASNSLEDYTGFDASEDKLIYRKSIMSFVDHYAALRLLERRCTRLPVDETIKLSLIAVNHKTLPYLPWEDMEKVIKKICQSTNTSNDDGSEDMIDKLKKLIDSERESENPPAAIVAFKTLLKISSSNTPLTERQYPPFKARIHCESSLAAILCHLHEHGIDEDNLRKLFQASPS